MFKEGRIKSMDKEKTASCIENLLAKAAFFPMFLIAPAPLYDKPHANIGHKAAEWRTGLDFESTYYTSGCTGLSVFKPRQSAAFSE